MIESGELTAAMEAAVGRSLESGKDCPRLDYLRGVDGASWLYCRLTDEVFGPGQRQEAPCLPLCAYPAQHLRGRCQHMDLSNVLATGGNPPLPRILCRAHVNFDAPGFCASCPDYSVLAEMS